MKKSKSMDFLILLRAKISSFNFPESESSLENKIFTSPQVLPQKSPAPLFPKSSFFLLARKRENLAIRPDLTVQLFSCWTLSSRINDQRHIQLDWSRWLRLETWPPVSWSGVVTERRDEFYWLGGDVSGLVSAPPLIGYNAKSQFRPPSHNLRLDSEYF